MHMRRLQSKREKFIYLEEGGEKPCNIDMKRKYENSYFKVHIRHTLSSYRQDQRQADDSHLEKKGKKIVKFN